jgi:hypothetical protein
MLVKTLVTTCQNTRYHNPQVSCVKLKSHVLLNAVIVALCTFFHSVELLSLQNRFFVGERKKLQVESSGKAQTALCGKQGIGYYTLTAVA